MAQDRIGESDARSMVQIADPRRRESVPRSMRRMSGAWRRALKWLSVALVALLLLAAAMWLRSAWTPAIELAPIPWTPGLRRQLAAAPIGFGFVRAPVLVA
jgi:hypothetical protein